VKKFSAQQNAQALWIAEQDIALALIINAKLEAMNKKEMKMNKKYLILIFFLLIGIVVANSDNLDLNENKTSPEVYKTLEKNQEAKVIVEITESQIKEDIKDIVGEEDVRHEFHDAIAVEVSKEDLKKLEKNPEVESIHVDKPVKALLADAVPLINASSVWPIRLSNFNITGVDETICILDTGADFSHPDLIGKNKTCVVDCVSKSCVINCSVSDDHGHGTHVAGIVGALGGVKGVAINSGLIAVKVLNSAGTGTTSDVDAGIDWCIANANTYNISVISLSLGTDCVETPEYCYSNYCDSSEPSTAPRINNATLRNISVIIAAGNNGNSTAISSPACIKNATTVSASTKSDSIASYSNRNSLTDLLAPGSSITSTKKSGGYETRTGTSMSTPQVSGAFAILRQFFRLQNNRVLSPAELQNYLNSTGKIIFDSSSGLNFSRIDIYSALVSLDSSNPSVALSSPSNNTNQFANNLTFNCSANDVLLRNATIYVWNSSKAVYNSSFASIEGINSVVQFNVTNFPSGSFEWNCLFYDSKGNFSFASSNFSFSITSLIVSLSGNNFTNQNQSIFNCSAQTSSGKNLVNMTFYLWNSTSSLINSQVKNLSGTLNSTLFYYNLSSEGEYKWNCKAFNSDSNSSLVDYNGTRILDLTSPNITLISPADSASYSSNSQSIVFNFNVSDNYNIANCTLIINNAVSLVNSSMLNLSIIQNFTQSFSPGIYNWKINCTDYAENLINSSSRSFEVIAVAVQQQGSGGSSGGGAAAIETSQVYTLTSNQILNGYTKDLNKNDKLKFFDRNSEEHSLSLDDVGEDSVTMTIRSSIIKITLGIGQSAKLNLSSSDYYDLYIRVDSIENKKVKLTIQLINEAIGSSSKEPEIITTPKEEIPTQRFSMGLREFLIIFLVFLIILISITIIMVIRRKKSTKEKTKKEYRDKFNKHVKPRKRE
jgi:subtilisin family serine protease